MRGRTPAQQSPMTASEDGRQVGGLNARRTMSDSVDPAVFRQKSSLSTAPFDCACRDPRCQELRSSHQSVLRIGEMPEDRLDRPTWTTHTGV